MSVRENNYEKLGPTYFPNISAKTRLSSLEELALAGRFRLSERTALNVLPKAELCSSSQKPFQKLIKIELTPFNSYPFNYYTAFFSGRQ